MKTSPFAVFTAIILSLVSIGHAVTVYTSNSALYESSAGNGLGWNYTGAVGGASGVYLGKYNGSYYVLTANHVGASNFTLGGTTYNLIANSYNQVASGLDLGVFAIAGDSQLDALTNLVLGSSLFTNTSLNMIGYGGGTKRGGYNTPDSVQMLSYDGYTERVIFTDYDSIEGQAQAISGDSGGGVFKQNGSSLELSGIMVVAGTDSNSGSLVTGSVDVGYYRTAILARVPEASTVTFWSVTGLFGIGYYLNSRRTQRKS